MSALLVANVTVNDPERFAKYGAKAPTVVAQYGGHYVARRGAVHDLEGRLGFDRLTVLEFPSMDALQRFYDSSEYAPLLALRKQTCQSTVAFIEGLAPL